MKLVIVEDGPSKGAVALDGSPPAYYYRPASTSAGTNKWRIHLRGGAWCFDEQSCLSRSKTNLGSSSVLPPSIPSSVVDDRPGGFMDGNATVAPHLHDWNMVFVEYLDGSSFTSNRDSPLNVSGTLLHMRGFNVLNAVLDHLEDNYKALSAATDFVLSGTSAGGLATYLHANHIRSRVTPTAKFVAMPDAGYFLDSPDIHGDYKFRAEMQAAFPMWNSSAGLDQKCLAAQGGPSSDTAWKCLFAQYVFPFLTDVPVYVVNSLYDPAQYGLILGLSCGSDLSRCSASELETAQKYRDYFQAHLAQVINSPSAGLWADACNYHEQTCAAVDWDGIMMNGVRQRDAFWSFYTSGGTNNETHVDVRWPDNRSCYQEPYKHGGC